jgi:hypothetical protein
VMSSVDGISLVQEKTVASWRLHADRKGP